ncbi:hypothetical protein [Rathayibacter tanaceti]|uniref:Uncharacterized protein n=3 Tax=Rathayibacter tanaceti TaxID=1671680 RepID=A0AAE6V827_9MICO|nr:hypothetical protein [Rathayibacter tanaceti]QHC56421.1 hypothetical protein GSU10_12775 [Rathayibacter tanaceti]
MDMSTIPFVEAAATTFARALVTAALPEVIGNLEGVPYGARARANESVLRARIAVLEEEQHALLRGVAGPGEKDFREVSVQLRALQNIADSLEEILGGASAS